MIKKSAILGLLFVLSGCALLQEGWNNTTQKTNNKICSIVSQEFAQTQNPWQAYQNVFISLFTQVPEDKKAEAAQEAENMKRQFAAVKTQLQIDQELSNFENDVKTTFNCPLEVQSLVTSKLDQYWDKLKQEDEAKQAQQYTAEVKRVEKKYGYKFCEGNVDGYVLQGITIPQNCLLHISDRFAHVLQQTANGTLYICNPPLYCSFLVSANKTDKNQVDNARMPAGYFVRTGSFNYNSVLGAGRTVYKLKRLETF